MFVRNKKLRRRKRRKTTKNFRIKNKKLFQLILKNNVCEKQEIEVIEKRQLVEKKEQNNILEDVEKR